MPFFSLDLIKLETFQMMRWTEKMISSNYTVRIFDKDNFW